jgi:hypothetical protein
MHLLIKIRTMHLYVKTSIVEKHSGLWPVAKKTCSPMQTIPFLSQHNKPLNKEAKHLEKRHVIKPNVKMNEQFFISSPFFNIIVQLQCISIEAVRLFKKNIRPNHTIFRQKGETKLLRRPTVNTCWLQSAVWERKWKTNMWSGPVCGLSLANN